MADMGTFKKYLTILEEIEGRIDRTINAYDEVLLDKLQISPKQLGRLLDELSNDIDSIVLEQKGRKKIYKLIKPVDIFIRAFKNSKDIGWFYDLAIKANPEVFKGLEKLTRSEKHVYLFKNTPFEDIDTIEAKEMFYKLRQAVRFNEYRDIKFLYEKEYQKELKCIKILFIDNNWYIAYVNKENKLKLGRIAFIQDVQYTKGKTTFQKYSTQEHLEFLENELQNSMTLYGVKKQKATLKALPPIAKYFKPDMKKFLSSQKYIKELDDGSVIFSVDFTQELEILPFVQKWMPDMVVLEPKSLKKAYIKKLKKCIDEQEKEKD